MKNEAWRIAAALPLLLCLPAAHALDFGVMETADLIAPGFFKFDAYPIQAREGPRQEGKTGVNVGLGYGISRRWDAELQWATYDDINFFGTDVEYNVVHGPHFDTSVSGGTHYGNSDFGTQWGLDLASITSYRLPSHPKVRVSGALDFAWDNADLHTHRLAGLDRHYLTAYLAPAAQYRVSRDVDVIGEIGLGMTPDSNNYGSLGLSFYFR